MNNFNTGDKVICVNNKYIFGVIRELKLHKIYTVKKISSHNQDSCLIDLEECNHFWVKNRFINIKNIPPYKIVAFMLTKNKIYLR